MARRRPPDHAGRRGEDLQGSQGQERPARVPADLLGSPRSRPRDTGERVPGRVSPGPSDRRPEVPGRRERRLQHRLRPHLHPARQAGRGAGRRGGQPRLPRPPDLDLPRPARPDVPGRQGRHRLRPRVPGAGRLLGAARSHRRGEGPAAQHRLPRGQGRAPDQAGRPAPEGHRGPSPLQAAAPGLRDRAPGLVPEGRRRWHGAARPPAWRCRRPRDGARAAARRP